MLKGFKFLGRILFALNVLLSIATFIGYSAPFVHPNTFWPAAFFGLALPYLIILNVVFLFIWIIRGSFRAFLPILILILGYQSIPKFIQLRFNPTVEEANSIKVLSFNVRVFDLYMWTKEKTTRNKIFDFLKEEQADIICLQEFFNADTQNPKYEFNTLDTLVQFLEAKNYHTYYTTTIRNNDHWGMVTFSKYPIVKKGMVNLEKAGGNACIYTDIKLKEDKIVRVYNAHLASIKLSKHDYKAMQEINQNQYSDDFGNEMMMVNKIKIGFKRRSQQADSIRASIDQSPFPSIICGDFNDTPSSYAYNQIKGESQDAFLTAGSGLGRTYIGEFPSFRIDYIFMNEAFEILEFNTHPEELSDHHPISAKFRLN